MPSTLSDAVSQNCKIGGRTTVSIHTPRAGHDMASAPTPTGQPKFGGLPDVAIPLCTVLPAQSLLHHLISCLVSSIAAALLDRLQAAAQSARRLPCQPGRCPVSQATALSARLLHSQPACCTVSQPAAPSASGPLQRLSCCPVSWQVAQVARALACLLVDCPVSQSTVRAAGSDMPHGRPVRVQRSV